MAKQEAFLVLLGNIHCETISNAMEIMKIDKKLGKLL